jgi:hypothetical protein
LLDKSPSDLAEEASGETSSSKSEGSGIADAFILRTAKEACPTTDSKYGNLCTYLETFKKHVAYSTVTDFGGKGRFSVPAGSYYLFGYSNFGDQLIAWSMKINLTSDQSITLDNRNAAGIM